MVRCCVRSCGCAARGKKLLPPACEVEVDWLMFLYVIYLLYTQGTTHKTQDQEEGQPAILCDMCNHIFIFQLCLHLSSTVKTLSTIQSITSETVSMRYSIIIFTTVLAKLNAAENIPRAVRGASLLNEGGCYGNSDCPDNYFCHVPDGDCFSGDIEGECYEMRASRTRSFNRVRNTIVLLHIFCNDSSDIIVLCLNIVIICFQFLSPILRSAVRYCRMYYF